MNEGIALLIITLNAVVFMVVTWMWLENKLPGWVAGVTPLITPFLYSIYLILNS